MTRPASHRCEYASRSVKGPEKTRNGDHALIQDLGDDAVVLAIADGVGSRPCDWRASEVACAAALEGIQEATQEATGPLARQIEAGIRKAHWTVGRETGRCEGMLAAVALAAWPRGSEEVVCAGIGDTRVYRVCPDRIEQITEDDVETKTIRQNSRTSLPGAPSTYRRDFLTQALGGDYELEIDVKEVPFPPGAGLALASDGAFPVGGFKSKLRRIFERPDLEGSLNGWFDPSGLSNADDATLALLRRSGLPEEIHQKCLDLLDRLAGCREQKIHPHLMLQVLMEEIEAALRDGNAQRIDQCARYIGRFSLRPGREALAEILDRIAHHPALGKETFERVHRLAQRDR